MARFFFQNKDPRDRVRVTNVGQGVWLIAATRWSERVKMRIFTDDGRAILADSGTEALQIAADILDGKRNWGDPS